MHSILVATLLGASLGQVLAQTNKPPQTHTIVFSDGGVAADPGLNNLKFPTPTAQLLPAGPLPSVCAEIGRSNDCAPSDFQVYSVTYSDCPVPKIFCKCKTNTVPIDTLARDFGRIPLRARERTRLFLAFRDGGCSGFSNGLDLWVDGRCVNRESVYIHETTHVLDWRKGHDDGFGTWWSHNPAWRTAVETDTCSVDTYSRANEYPEGFAQTGVMIAYDQNVSPVWTTWPNITCMTNQLFRGYDALLQYFDPREQTGQCTQAVRVGPMVCASEELRAAGKCENLDDTFQINEAQFEGVTFFDVEPSTEILGSTFD